MSLFELLSVLVTLGALFSFVSARWLHLPTTIGTMILSLAGAALLIAVGQAVPGLHAMAAHTVGEIDLNRVVLHGMLAFLLFAGALQLNLEHLVRQRVPVLVLSVVTTALSTVLVAILFRSGARLLHVDVAWVPALLFGALISPTDPIAVLDMLRRANAPPDLEVQLAGESLFNDGIGAVMFLSLLGASEGGALPSATVFGGLLLVKAGGGIALGVALGYATYRLLRQVDDYKVEVLLTLALAMGGYALADVLTLSAPLEVVAAGLLVGGPARTHAMSRITRQNLDLFWELIDATLNVVLFLLMGLEILVLPFTPRFLALGLLAIPAVLLARWISVTAVVRPMGWFRQLIPGSIMVLTWGGLRGGLAVALALSLPHDAALMRSLLLVVTFVVVVFSIVVQGLTLPAVLRRFTRTEA